MKQENLASRLLYLPLDIHEKVLLWLAYRGLKPVSEITVERRNYAQLRKRSFKSTYDDKSPKIERIRKWIHDAGLYYVVEPKYPSSWHVSKEKNKALLSTKLLHKKDYESEYQSGTLFGFPENSAKAYAQNQTKENSVDVVWPGMLSSHPLLKDKYYLPYIFYAIRADRVKEDILIAKQWADTIRSEIPTLARWFERNRARN